VFKKRIMSKNHQESEKAERGGVRPDSSGAASKERPKRNLQKPCLRMRRCLYVGRRKRGPVGQWRNFIKLGKVEKETRIKIGSIV
jgi:hypothetical protein